MCIRDRWNGSGGIEILNVFTAGGNEDEDSQKEKKGFELHTR